MRSEFISLGFRDPCWEIFSCNLVDVKPIRPVDCWSPMTGQYFEHEGHLFSNLRLVISYFCDVFLFHGFSLSLHSGDRTRDKPHYGTANMFLQCISSHRFMTSVLQFLQLKNIPSCYYFGYERIPRKRPLLFYYPYLTLYLGWYTRFLLDFSRRSHIRCCSSIQPSCRCMIFAHFLPLCFW